MSGSLLTASQVGELLGVPTSWVYEQSRRGTIPTVTLGRYRRYRREAIESWVAELEVGEGGGGARRRAGVQVVVSGSRDSAPARARSRAEVRA
ncbi:MAG: helix-turn-helix domain-containing protein [Solirubrobacterales bacterium]